MKKIISAALLFFSSFLYAQECSVQTCQTTVGSSCVKKDDSIFYYKQGGLDQAAMDAQCSSFVGSSAQWNPERQAYQCMRDGKDVGFGLNLGPIYKQVETLFCSVSDKPKPPQYCTLKSCIETMGRESPDSMCFHSFGTIFYRPHLGETAEFCTLGDAGDEDIPCFGNVMICSESRPPDWIDPNTKIPCWGELCGNPNVLPPDYENPETGVPCYGNMCDPNKPNTGNGGDGGNNGGDGGNGNGNGEGGENVCIGDWCVDLPSNGSGGLGFGDGQTVKLPDSFWKKQDKDTIKDKYKREIERKNPYNFKNINTSINGSGQCPVFKFDYLGDISPPCSFWEMLAAFGSFISTFMAFVIVFWRR